MNHLLYTLVTVRDRWLPRLRIHSILFVQGSGGLPTGTLQGIVSLGTVVHLKTIYNLNAGSGEKKIDEIHDVQASTAYRADHERNMYIIIYI